MTSVTDNRPHSKWRYLIFLNLYLVHFPYRHYDNFIVVDGGQKKKDVGDATERGKADDEDDEDMDIVEDRAEDHAHLPFWAEF